MQDTVARVGRFVVNVRSIHFAPTDYQEEGLACAMTALLAKHFEIQFTEPVVSFNAERNRYELGFSRP